MQAMQYTIKLPSDYDMDIIRQRVRNTGHLMDGFDDLFFKVYLISEKSEGQLFNSYCPLYIWKNTNGMTKFIFDGYFDHILNSFGWQNIEIGVTSSVEISDHFDSSKYATLEVIDIEVSESLKSFAIHEQMQTTKVAKSLFSILINGKNVSLLFIPINPTHNYQHLKFYTFHNKHL